MSKEATYNKHIQPLIEQIQRICMREDISMIAQFELTEAGQDPMAIVAIDLADDASSDMQSQARNLMQQARDAGGSVVKKPHQELRAKGSTN